MVGEDKEVMSTKELRRLSVVRQAMQKKMTQRAAGEALGLSERQLRRLIRRIRAEGEAGIAHRGRGKRSNRGLAAKRKAEILRLYKRQYADFGPTLAAEKLLERDQIAVSDETLRQWLLAEGIDHFRRRARPHRAWRQRRSHVGELIQMDGSHHLWFEDRGPKCVLMAYIDDASSCVQARFYEYEGTIPAMESFKRYVKRYGLPLAVYADKHTTYKSPAEATINEQLEDRAPQSQFERALGELGVKMIHAHSPQAKGRVERLFKTFQDRLVKEMRLAGISSIEAANRFLLEYLPIYNRRFSVKPAQEANLHRPRPGLRVLDQILCIKTERTLRRDFTVAHDRKLYQIEDNLRAQRVTVEERLDGSMRITHQERRLRYRQITTRPLRAHETPKSPSQRPRTKPSPQHPWKKHPWLRKKKEPCASLS
ncbi:ISNCY family transposase [Candidatus Manganitrophus noduliformans]|uniref:ISNCY family transposase n=1 Tax=Candidatus Manganitrophus noduliformans TaxID=2606439 RepID=A0A7X6DVS8_9BACT|nr:ISNCY family transposase [Candidatus Manganitrophus noduliformans]NKE73834.1 ISNCY family transposase [Candidatus Manganitrophus noduliformans]